MKRWQMLRLKVVLIPVVLFLFLTGACATSTSNSAAKVQVLSTATPEEAGFSSERLGRIDAVLAVDVEKNAYDGAVLLIARKGQIAYFKSFGKRDPEKDLPMENDAIFRVFSMTKTVTAVAVLQLMEEGKLLLSDPVFKYLPAFRDVQVGEITRNAEGKEEMTLRPPARHMTILDLLRHTSGLSYWFMAPRLIQAEYIKSGMRDMLGLTSLEACEKIAALPLVADPATQYNYGVSFDVLGGIVEVISGKPLDQYVNEKICQPLGMKDSGYFVPAEAADRLAYLSSKSPFYTDPTSAESKFVNGGGGMVGSAMDFARFGQMMLNGGELDGVRLLSPATIALMSADQLVDIGHPTDPKYQPGPGYGQGFGLYVRTSAGGAYGLGSVGEYCKQGIAGTIFWVDPKQELVAVFMISNLARREYCRWMVKDMIYQAIVE